MKLESWFGGACANCKRQDKGYECEVRDTDKSDFREPPLTPKDDYQTTRGRITRAPRNYKDTDGRKTS